MFDQSVHDDLAFPDMHTLSHDVLMHVYFLYEYYCSMYSWANYSLLCFKYMNKLSNFLSLTGSTVIPPCDDQLYPSDDRWHVLLYKKDKPAHAYMIVLVGCIQSP